MAALFDYKPSGPLGAPDVGASVKAMGEAAVASSKPIEEPLDFLGITSKVTTAISKRQAPLDKHQAYLDTIKFNSEINSLSGADKVAKIEERIKEHASGDYSDWYREGALSVLDPMYSKALNEAEGDRQKSVSNVISSTGSTEWNYAGNFKDRIKELSGDLRIKEDKATLAYKTGIVNYFSGIATTADTPEELNEITVALNKTLSKFNSEVGDAGTKTSVSEGKALFKSTIANKKAEFKFIAQKAYASYIGDTSSIDTSYLVSPSNPEYRKSLNATKSSPIERNNELNSYTKKYNDTQEAREFAFIPGIKMEKAPNTTNSILMKDISKKVVSAGLQAFQNGDVSSLIDIASYNSNFMGDFNKAASTLFNNIQTTEDSAKAIGLIDKLSVEDGGYNTLARVFPKSLNKVMTTVLTAKYLTNGDLAQARDYMAQTQATPKAANIDKDTFRDITDNSKDLGPLGSYYSNMCMSMYKLNPGLPKEAYEELYDKMKRNIIDKGNSNFIDTTSTTPEHKAILERDDIYGKEVTEVFNMSEGDTAKVSRDTVIVRTATGAIKDVYDINSAIEGVREEAKVKAAERSKHKGVVDLFDNVNTRDEVKGTYNPWIED